MRAALLAVPAYNQCRGKGDPAVGVKDFYPWPRQLPDTRRKWTIREIIETMPSQS